MMIGPLMTEDEYWRIEWESQHQIDRRKLDVAAEKRERIAARLREVQERTVRGPDFTLVCCSTGRAAQAAAIAVGGLHAAWECPLCFNGS